MISKASNNKPLVLCFHHAGGSVVAFKDWQKREEVDFLPIEFPHRSIPTNKFNMDTIDSDVVINKIVNEVYPIIKDKCFYVYGHSMGALIGFELCVKLENTYGIKPKKLFVSGREAPHMPDLSPYKSCMGKEALIRELKRLGGTPEEVYENKEILDYFLPIIQNDYRLLESFVYGQEKIDTPIIAHAAEEDTEAGPHIMKEWYYVTSRDFVLEKFKGSHFFLFELKDEYLNFLVKEILNDFEQYQRK